MNNVIQEYSVLKLPKESGDSIIVTSHSVGLASFNPKEYDIELRGYTIKITKLDNSFKV